MLGGLLILVEFNSKHGSGPLPAGSTLLLCGGVCVCVSVCVREFDESPTRKLCVACNIVSSFVAYLLHAFKV